jgi:Protein of unknown function (DUF1493)
MEQAVLDFVKVKLWEPDNARLSLETSLNHDIGVDGMDAEAFMVAFFKHFDIQNGHEMQFYSYFGTEGADLTGCYLLLLWILFYPLMRWYANKYPHKFKPQASLTVQHLVEVAKKGEWFEVTNDAVVITAPLIKLS